VAARHKSALKARRQNAKSREHNRQLRSKLRTALKGIRASIETKELDDARANLRQVTSLIDKMAGKGIIHDNTAARYKSRLTRQLASASAA